MSTISMAVPEEDETTRESSIPTLKIEWFRVPDHQMSSDMKSIMDTLRSKYKKMNDKFLSHFEKKFIVFIEDGIDLRKDANLFKKEAQYKAQTTP